MTAMQLGLMMRDLRQFPFLCRVMAEAPGLPQTMALDELHMLAEEVFPRVRGA